MRACKSGDKVERSYVCMFPAFCCFFHSRLFDATSKKMKNVSCFQHKSKADLKRDSAERFPTQSEIFHLK